MPTDQSRLDWLEDGETIVAHYRFISSRPLMVLLLVVGFGLLGLMGAASLGGTSLRWAMVGVTPLLGLAIIMPITFHEILATDRRLVDHRCGRRSVLRWSDVQTVELETIQHWQRLRIRGNDVRLSIRPHPDWHGYRAIADEVGRRCGECQHIGPRPGSPSWDERLDLAHQEGTPRPRRRRRACRKTIPIATARFPAQD